MSINQHLNATIALIHGDMKLVREILRSPGSDVKNVPQVVSALAQALDEVRADAVTVAKHEADIALVIKELTAVQVDSLGIEPGESLTPELKNSFMNGVEAVEKLISDRIKRHRYELRHDN
jgi:hypothetical protein